MRGAIRIDSQIDINPGKLNMASILTDRQALIAGVLSQYLILALAAASPAPSAILSSDNANQNITVPFEFCKTNFEKSNVTVSSNDTKPRSK